MFIPSQFIDDLIRDADIVSVIGQHVQLKAKGSSHLGLCPFHKEKTPSFNVVPTKNFYHCFGCGASGNALSFLKTYKHGNDFIAAVEDLAAQMGREVPRVASKRPRVTIKYLDELAAFYHKALRKNENIKQYLKNRGINEATAILYKLGYAPKDGGLDDAFSTKPSDKELIRIGILKEKEDKSNYVFFKDRVMFPISNNAGKVCGFGGRVVKKAEPKYLNSPQSIAFDKGKIIYGLAQASDGIRDHKKVIVVEGYMDVVSLAEHGIRNAVATMGTAATIEQIRMLLIRSPEIIFCFDGDDAGLKAAKKVLVNLMPVLTDGKSIKFILLNKGEDPDSLVRDKGKAEFTKLIDAAISLEAILTQNYLEGKGKKLTAAQKSEKWHEVAGLLESMNLNKAAFLYEQLYKELADASGIDRNELKEAAKKVMQTQKSYSEYKPVTPAKIRDRKMKEHVLFHLLVCLHMEPKLIKFVNENTPLFSESIADINLCQEIISKLHNQSNNGAKDVTVLSILAAKQAKMLMQQIVQKANSFKDGGENPELAIQNLIKKLEKRAKDKLARSEIQKQLARI